MTIYIPTKLKRERLGLFGDGGSGKSQALLDIAMETPGHKYIIDVDYTSYWDQALEEFPELEAKLTVATLATDDWTPYLELLPEWREEAGPDDWLFIDSMTHSWQACQSYYSAETLGMQFDELIANARKAQLKSKGKAMMVFQGDTDWRVINSHYIPATWGQITKWPGHVALTFQEKKMTDDANREKNWKDFEGYRPEAQKAAKYATRTFLHMYKRGRNSYYIDTVKDRFRPKLDEEEWGAENDEGSFVEKYLVEVGGWVKKPAKKKVEKTGEGDGASA